MGLLRLLLSCLQDFPLALRASVFTPTKKPIKQQYKNLKKQSRNTPLGPFPSSPPMYKSGGKKDEIGPISLSLTRALFESYFWFPFLFEGVFVDKCEREKERYTCFYNSFSLISIRKMRQPMRDEAAVRASHKVKKKIVPSKIKGNSSAKKVYSPLPCMLGLAQMSEGALLLTLVTLYGNSRPHSHRALSPLAIRLEEESNGEKKRGAQSNTLNAPPHHGEETHQVGNA